eukprot:m.31977 g.31977  ORF g.31977 m.31977 type:complete len:51 (-) comp10740_c0_seq1:875-1027(-)
MASSIFRPILQALAPHVPVLPLVLLPYFSNMRDSSSSNSRGPAGAIISLA